MTGGLHYIHDRIDKLVEQAALEVALLRLHTGVDPAGSRSEEDHSIQLTRQRFWAAQDAAAQDHQQDLRER
jgi:hypothetical protein